MKQHFIDLRYSSRHAIEQLLDQAEQLIDPETQKIKRTLSCAGKMVMLLFFEPSTRTKTTFEIAARWQGCDVVNFAVTTSSTTKGETLFDTISNIIAMRTDLIVIRHAQSGVLEWVTQKFGQHVAVVNAGDGCHAHPSQALIDLFTIKHYKKNFSQLKVAIVGDILHSRVARSDIYALNIMGVNEIRLIGPRTLVPHAFSSLGAKIYHNLEQGLSGVDVVIVLRLQRERMNANYVPDEQEFFEFYGVTTEKLKCAKPDVLVMHPGPMNRGVEISSTVADGPQSVILQQVQFGIAVRMAILNQVLMHND